MAICKICGKKGFFMKVDSCGRCKECQIKHLKEENERKSAYERVALDNQEKENLFPLSLHSYVVTDIETSGLNCNTDSIIEISAIKVLNNEVIGRYSSLIHQDISLDPAVQSLTGITSNMLKKCPKTLKEVIKEYSDFIGSYPLIGHNINNFDIRFINRAYVKVLHTPIHNRCVDTLPLSRKYIHDSSDHKLQTLARHLNLSTDHAHRALSDCQTTLDLYKFICKVAPAKHPKQNESKCKTNELTPEDSLIISSMKTIFQNIDHSYIRYEKVGSYLRFRCYYEIFRIKTSGRIKNYIVFAHKYEQDILDKVTLKTASATSADGVGKTRIFFDDEEGLIALSKSIIKISQDQKAEVDNYINSEHNYDNTGFIRIESYAPHYEKSVKKYLDSPALFKL